MKLHAPRQQRGAALAIALLMLIIITLLGVAAVRATRDELRLSQNAESRMAAIQGAESMVSLVSNNPANMPVNGDDSFSACVLPATVATTAGITCTASTIDMAGAAPLLASYGYALVKRELPLFVEVGVLREAELSAKNYDFARFTVTGGLDRSAQSLSAAQVVEGTLKLHTKVSGVNYE